MPADRPKRASRDADEEAPSDRAGTRERAASHDHVERRRRGRPGPVQRLIPDRRVRRTIEWVLLIVLALGVAFVLRTYVVQSFYIPSTSMTPTLQVKDRVLVNKLAYRFGEPSRGDIAVFDAPPGEGTATVQDLIKRVIGMPGETIEGRDGRIYVDGRPLDEPWLPAGTPLRSFGPDAVPEGHFYMLGDDRSNSRDSRSFGAIPEDTLVGRAFLRIWPPSSFSTL